jgi:hypothetical protein
MAGKPGPQRPAKVRKREGAPTEIPLDPIALLNRPRPQASVDQDSGLQMIVDDDGLVKTVFIKPTKLGATLRPLGTNFFSLGRSAIRQRMGPVSKTAKAWDRFDRNDVAIHFEYGPADDVALVTLMWIPRLLPHLR